MSFDNFILLFIGIVLFGTLAVSGWFFITRGQIKTREDGTKEKKGKIFKGWYFFWTQTKEQKEKVFFNEPNLFEFYMKIKDHFTLKEFIANMELKENNFLFKNSERFIEQRRWIEKTFEVKFYDLGGGLYQVYKEYDVYLFPSWVRDPLAVCATCFASIYGSLFYWLLIALVKQNLFVWSNVPVLAAFFFWIVFCFSLAVLNTALAKKFN